MVVPLVGGAARELTRTKLPAQLQPINGFTWSPDSRYVYFFMRPTATRRTSSIG